MKKSTAWIAAFAAVIATAAFAATAATVTPSPELVVNGNFEAGADIPNGKYQESLNGSDNAYIPGWTMQNCVKTAADGTYALANHGYTICYSAIATKVANADNPSWFYQDVTVPAGGDYTLSFEFCGRPNKNKKGQYDKKNLYVTVYLSEVENGEVSGDETVFIPQFQSDQVDPVQSKSVTKFLAAGTYRLKFYTSRLNQDDASVWFDNISLRRVESILSNCYFDDFPTTDHGSKIGYFLYNHEDGYSCPNWEGTIGLTGIARAGSTWCSGSLQAGVNVAFIQSAGSSSAMWQDVALSEPGMYTLSFKYAGRPTNLGQNVKILFGQLTEEKTDLAEATDLVDEFTSTVGDQWTEVKLRLAAFVPGTYRLKIVGSSSSDTGTVFDDFRLWLDDEMIENGDFEESKATANPWGAYMHLSGTSNPGWTASPNNSVGLGNANGTWVARKIDIGRWAMYIQNASGVNNVKAWQDVHVAVPGRYTLKHNYIGRPGCTGQSLTTQMGAVLNDDIDRSRVSFSETWTVNDATTLAAFEKENFEVPAAGEYRVRFIGKNPHDDSRDIATAIDCVSLKREPNYVYWTGGGDGTTMSAPANWGVESISYADDFVFTNDAPLAVNLTADFAGATINFLGTGSVTLNGIMDAGEPVSTNTLSVAQIYSAPSAAAALFNCPVRFFDGYDVVSRATNTFALGATATVWKRGQGAGACVLDGDFEFTADTLVLDGNVTVAAGRTLRAGALTGVYNDSITIGDNAKVFLTGDIATFSGATPLLVVRLAETAELWATNSTAVASRHFFTGTRTKGTANVGGIVLNTANYDTGLYVGRINIGSGGVTHNGSAKGVYMDVANNASASAEMTFGAFADWTWTPGGNGKFILYKNIFTFDTLDCFDGETPHTITLAAPTIDDTNERSVIRKINPGTLVLAASNYLRCGLQVEGGVVRVAADQGSGLGPATVSSGATLEVVSGGVLRNSSVTVVDGGTLALGDGGTLVSPVSAEGEVRVSGAATITAGGSIAITGGGTLAFDEGAKIIVGSDVAAGTTLVTGAGLTAEDLAARFVTPFGAVSLDNSGNVVYTSAIEWISGASGADDGIYLGFAGGHAANMLQTAALAEEDLVRYKEDKAPGNAAGVSPNTVLADGDVNPIVEDVDFGKIYSLDKGTYTFTFASPTNIGEVAIFTRWGNGGRDGIKISKVLVKTEGSDEWKEISAGAFSAGLSDFGSSTGAMVAVLKRKDGLLLASGVTALKFVFPSGQDNNGTGFTELAAFDRYIPVAKVWTWNGSAGNTLFSDAGNWEDASGNAAGAAGEAFSTACSDTIKIPAGVQVTMDVSADVAMAELGGGVTFANPAPDAVTGAVATNVLSCAYISNAVGEETRFDCAVGFTGKYYVHADGLVRFAGGATATSMGEAGGAYMRTLAGDITLSGDFDIIDASDEYWCVTDASRFTAGVLKKNSTAGDVNGTPNFRICEGASAHFTSITSGRDRLTISVQGELAVDGYYDTMSVIDTRNSNTFAGDFGYPGDEAFSGSTVRACGIRRRKYSTNTAYVDWMTYCYPANWYIGSDGIQLEYKAFPIEFAGCPKYIYATADFTISGYSTAESSDKADWGVGCAADTTLDTQGHTVTWNAGAVLRNNITFTKAGEGTLVMEPYGAKISDGTPSVVVAGGTLEARACTIGTDMDPLFGGVPVTVKNGAVLRIASGVTSVTNAVTLEAGATLAVDAIDERDALASSTGPLTATGRAKVKITGTLPDSVFSTGTNFVIAASCDAASLANISLDKSGLVFENAGKCSNARLDVVDGKLVVSVKPYFYIKVR